MRLFPSNNEKMITISIVSFVTGTFVGLFALYDLVTSSETLNNDTIPIFSMMAAWAGALGTISAVVIAIWLPKIQQEKLKHESRNNAKKLISAQLIVIKDSLKTHHGAIKLNGVLHSPVANLEYFPDSVQSHIQISSLTSLYELSHEVKLAEQARQKFFEYQAVGDTRNMILQTKAYNGLITKCYDGVGAMINQFKS